MKTGRQMLSEKRDKRTLWIILALLTAIVFFLSLALGRYSILLSDVFHIVFGKLLGLTETWSVQDGRLLLNIRLPRVLAALLIGGALAVSGCTYQGLFKNAMASPDLLGVSSGACFGAAVAVIMQASLPVVQGTAFFFGFAAVGLTVLISAAAFKKADITLTTVLIGMAVSVLFTTFLSVAQMLADPSTSLLRTRFWLMGSLSSVSYQQLFLLVPMLFCGLLPIFLLRWQLNGMVFGDEEAKSMGIRTGTVRLLCIFCATLLTAAAVAVSGVIPWVGLLIPHLMRMVVGPDFRRLLPASFFAGAIFLMVVDDAARSVFAFELPIGMLTSILGMTFYVGLVIFRRRAVL